MKEIISGVYILLGRGYNCNAYLITGDNSALLIDAGLGYFGTVWGYNISQQQELEEVLNKFDYINKIYQQHEPLLEQLDHLYKLSEELKSDRFSNFKILQEKVYEFTAMLEQHEDNENCMILDAYNIDIGTHD